VATKIVPLPLGPAPERRLIYGSDSDHDSDDDRAHDSDDEDDDDIFENPPPTKKPIAIKKRKEEVLAPIDELVVGGKFPDANGQAGHIRLKNKFVQETEKANNATYGNATFCIAVNKTSAKALGKQKGQLQINCCHDGRKKRGDCACVFGLSAYVKNSSARITYINMDHGKDCKVYTDGGRTRGVKTAFLDLDGPGSWASSLLMPSPLTSTTARASSVTMPSRWTWGCVNTER
jgi:hypothetical protein